VAATLARALPAGLPLLVTTVTPTGQERARAALGRRARIAYLPFDLGFAVHRFFRRHEPRALVLVEGDYWPLVLRAARQRGLPVAVINGRVGDASFRRLARASRIFGPLFGGATGSGLFGGIARFGVQSAADRERLLALGIPPERVTVTGNLKFESPEPPPRPALEGAVAALAGGRPVLVAGSTVAGEEDHVLAAFAGAGGGEAALLVLAPRRPERWDEVARRLDAAGLAAVRRSSLGEPPDDLPDPGTAPGRPAVLLLDSLGELAGLYRIAAAAFVGGTLVPAGGHNPVEPARFGIPVAVGPSMENFRQIAEDFDCAAAWERAADAAALGAIWRRWLDDPATAHEIGERAAALVESNRGALARTLEVLREAMPEVLGTAGTGAGGGGDRISDPGSGAAYRSPADTRAAGARQ
jgi:3-deoxy-D-manno-octulosonic-acid transferase